MPTSDPSRVFDTTCLPADDELARERWLHQVLMEAMEQQSDQRRSYIEAACEGCDEFLTTLISRLLDAESFEEESSTPSHREVRTHIGGYRVERELGRGGMGVVYLATREDDFTMQVAIKLVRADQDAERLVQAFHRERQILASLQHPYITQIYDGGTTEDGCPYLVMEYVAGLPLTQYIETYSPSLSECIELFIKICDAVGFAHQNMVIHRDLKPQNILITRDGQPKLLDFGIASVLEQEATLPPVSIQTEVGRLTPEYAGPEQIRGERLTAAADVYALGVILYELLTGKLPHRFKTHNPMEWRDVICNQVPVRAGVAIRHRHRRKGEQHHDGRLPSWRRLPGDLCAIACKALAKDPRQRYGSAAALSSDLRRYVSRRPVEACRAGFGYRLSRWFSRNRVPAAAFLVVAGVALTAWVQRESAIRERDEALRAQRGAVAESAFLRDMLQAADPRLNPDQPLSVLAMLERATAEIDQGEDKPPLHRARLYLGLGEVYQKYGDAARAETLLRRGLSLRSDLGPPADELQVQLQKQLGVALGAGGRLDEGLALLHQAGEDLEALSGNRMMLRADIERWRSEFYFAKGWTARAESSAQRVVRLLVGEPGAALMRGAAYRILADVAGDAGDVLGREANLRHALDQYCVVAEQEPVAYHTLSAKFAQLAAHKGQFQGAEARFQEALSVLSNRPGQADLIARLIVMDGLIGVLLDQEQVGAAEDWLAHGEHLIVARWGADSVALSRYAYVRRAQVALLDGRYQEALQWFERVLEVEEVFFAHPALVETHLSLGRLEEAQCMAVAALDRLNGLSVPDPGRRVAYYRLLARIASEAGTYEQALAYQQEARRILRAFGMWDLAWGGYLRVEMAGTELALNHDGMAANLLNEAEPLIRAHFQPDHSVHDLYRHYWAAQLSRRGMMRRTESPVERNVRGLSRKMLRTGEAEATAADEKTATVVDPR
ncbi:serine/threonine-protein kinase [Acanthopleuribacter pedis]|uniref:Protein kinase n=1 Tax=Acanthopleuribacter pedis TaxID=442870 RepID=A0A8J7QD24_9BACT|nr:serine/threonine-protein kinase [Acanthopleuribacter pedis]MBO1318776.1 protein kinase [Acanthopleuribacter pedis]